MKVLKKDTISYPKIYFNGLSTRISDEELTKKLDEIKEIEEVYIYHGSHELRGAIKCKDNRHLVEVADKLNTIRIDGYRIKTRISKGHEESHHSSKSSKEAPSGQNTLMAIFKTIEENTQLHQSDMVEAPENPYGSDLYVGGIPDDCTEEELVHYFNKVLNLTQLNIYPGDPCLSCTISGRAAFLHCRSEKEVNNALNLDQIPYRGLKLKVGRPTQYKGPTHVHSTFPEKFQNLLLPEMSPEFNLCYKKVLNAMPPVPDEIVAIYSNLLQVKHTRFLEIRHLLTVEDVTDDYDYDYTYNDIMNKLKEFGTVQQLIILRGGEHVGFIYIEYETVENTENAVTQLKQLLFDNKYVNPEYITEEQFKQLSSFDQ